MLGRLDVRDEPVVDHRAAQVGDRPEQVKGALRLASRHFGPPALRPLGDEVPAIGLLEAVGERQDVERRVADERVAPVDDRPPVFVTCRPPDPAPAARAPP